MRWWWPTSLLPRYLIDPRDRLRSVRGYRGEIYPRVITGSVAKDCYWCILMRQLNGAVIISAVLRLSEKIGGWASSPRWTGRTGQVTLEIHLSQRGRSQFVSRRRALLAGLKNLLPARGICTRRGAARRFAARCVHAYFFSSPSLSFAFFIKRSRCE